MCPAAEGPGAATNRADVDRRNGNTSSGAGVGGAHRRGSAVTGVPRHRWVGSGGDPPTEVATVPFPTDRLLGNLLMGVVMFEDILTGPDRHRQPAAYTAATEAHDRLRAAFEAVSRNHTAFDDWSTPEPDPSAPGPVRGSGEGGG